MTAPLLSAFAPDEPFVPVDPDDVLAGSPTTSTRPLLSTSGAVEAGVWVITEGTVRDVEVAEAFVVLAGRARLTINDEAPREITTGDVVTFEAGDATVWEVTETLRKFYVCLEE